MKPKEVHFLTINSTQTIPSTRFLFEEFNQKGFVIFLTECSIESLKKYYTHGFYFCLASFKIKSQFLNQSLFIKLKKYIKLIWYIISKTLDKSEKVLYVFDLQIFCLIGLILKVVGKKNIKLVYHQYELIEKCKSSFSVNLTITISKKLIHLIDLFVCPEINRIKYFENSMGYFGKSLLLYNSLTRKNIPERNKIINEIVPENAVCIGHVGNFGVDHYANELISLIKYCKNNKNIWFILIGKLEKEVSDKLEQINTQKLILIDEIPHDKLSYYYQRIDIGLILYKGVDLNFEYCAPNKLFEYWSHGVFVIAHHLSGLKSFEDSKKMLKLFNLSKTDLIVDFIENSYEKGEQIRKERIDQFSNIYTIDNQLNQISSFLMA